MDGNGQKRLMTIEDLEEMLQCKRSWIYQKTYSKELPHYKLSGLLRFDIDEIEEWLRNQHEGQ